MSKKYLIDQTQCYVSGFTKVSFEPSDAKEVEVLDKDDACFIFEDFCNKSSLQYFSDYLAANNLQIIKTVK